MTNFRLVLPCDAQRSSIDQSFEFRSMIEEPLDEKFLTRYYFLLLNIYLINHLTFSINKKLINCLKIRKSLIWQSRVFDCNVGNIFKSLECLYCVFRSTNEYTGEWLILRRHRLWPTNEVIPRCYFVCLCKGSLETRYATRVTANSRGGILISQSC